MKRKLFQLSISTPDGRFIARYSTKGLAELNFPKVGSARRADRPPQRGVPTAIRLWHRTMEATLQNVLAGRAAKNQPPLDLNAGTEFQQQVWNALRKIPFGETKSYGEIAQTIGKPKAVRAVGGACGANPIPVLIPCHRVLAANKKLGGFSGGLDWKRKLLSREGIKL